MLGNSLKYLNALMSSIFYLFKQDCISHTSHSQNPLFRYIIHFVFGIFADLSFLFQATFSQVSPVCMNWTIDSMQRKLIRLNSRTPGVKVDD